MFSSRSGPSSGNRGTRGDIGSDGATNKYLTADELAAHKEAARLGLRVVGSAGMLLPEKEKSLIPAVAVHLKTMRVNDLSGNTDLHEHVLRTAGEE